MSPAQKLRDVCDRIMANPKLQPHDGKTFCSLAVTWICEEYDITEFEGLLANQIYDILASGRNWREVDGEVANKIANNGKIAIAAQKGRPHGHVAVVYPGAMVWSTKWGREAPVLANVGKRNGVLGANWAFAKEPEYFAQKI